MANLRAAGWFCLCSLGQRGWDAARSSSLWLRKSQNGEVSYNWQHILPSCSGNHGSDSLHASWASFPEQPGPSAGFNSKQKAYEWFASRPLHRWISVPGFTGQTEIDAKVVIVIVVVHGRSEVNRGIGVHNKTCGFKSSSTFRFLDNQRMNRVIGSPPAQQTLGIAKTYVPNQAKSLARAKLATTPNILPGVVVVWAVVNLHSDPGSLHLSLRLGRSPWDM